MHRPSLCPVVELNEPLLKRPPQTSSAFKLFRVQGQVAQLPTAMPEPSKLVDLARTSSRRLARPPRVALCSPHSCLLLGAPWGATAWVVALPCACHQKLHGQQRSASFTQTGHALEQGPARCPCRIPDPPCTAGQQASPRHSSGRPPSTASSTSGLPWSRCTCGRWGGWGGWGGVGGWAPRGGPARSCARGL
jgi:hypothetical protein